MRICLAPPNAMSYPVGGHLWVFLNWALGFRSLGHEVIWLEMSKPTDTAETLAVQMAEFRQQLAVFGFDQSIALCTPEGKPSPHESALGLRPLDEALGADVLCNHRYDLPREMVRSFRRSMWVDIDPGQFQTAIEMGTYAFVPHTSYFTVGEWPKFQKPPTGFTTHGVTWHYVPPPVDLEAWPVTPAGPNAAFTTVSNWFDGGWMPMPGKPGDYYDNSKRVAFQPYLDLPRQTGLPLELALNLGDYQPEMDLLRGLGWRLRLSGEVSDPQVYRRYLQASLGEFSSAKQAYILLQTGWLSDRTASYLASGKPAVVLKTGPSDIFPDADGILRFTDAASAAAMLKDVMANYDHHCRAARQVAETHLDARKVLKRALELAVS